MTAAKRTRVTVLGADAKEPSWAAPLAGRAVEVVAVDGLDGLLAEGAGLAVAFTDAASAARIAEEAARRPGAPPLALLVGGAPEEHPHGRLLDALQKAKNDWEHAFDAMLDAVAVIDRAGRVSRANLQLARALSRPVTEIVGRPYTELLGPPLAPTTMGTAPPEEPADPIAESLADHQPRVMEARYSRLPGRHEVTVSPSGEPGDAARRLVVILKDVSDRREQQERILLASRLADIGQLAAGVAHEINTPLASIALRAESLLKSAEDPRLQALDSFRNFPRYLKTIDEEIFRCKRIIGALLDFSRARRTEVKDTDVNALAAQATDLVRHQMKLRQIGLEVALEPGLPPLRADEGQVRQAMLAILMNALDASTAGGEVRLQTRTDGEGALVVSVRDTGSGIAPEHLDKIFSPFFTTKPVGQGTGLGLAICHGIVTSHGGRIDVASAPGRGTTVSLVFPRNPAAGDP